MTPEKVAMVTAGGSGMGAGAARRQADLREAHLSGRAKKQKGVTSRDSLGEAAKLPIIPPMR